MSRKKRAQRPERLTDAYGHATFSREQVESGLHQERVLRDRLLQQSQAHQREKRALEDQLAVCEGRVRSLMNELRLARRER